MFLASSEEFMAEFIFFGILFRFVEIVHVQLANKRREVVVFEVFWKNFFREFIYIFYNEGISFLVPGDDIKVCRILEERKSDKKKKKRVYIKNVIGLDQKGWDIWLWLKVDVIFVVEFVFDHDSCTEE